MTAVVAVIVSACVCDDGLEFLAILSKFDLFATILFVELVTTSVTVIVERDDAVALNPVKRFVVEGSEVS